VWESQVTALPVSDKPITEADYLAFERTSEIKHEFIDGEIYAMTGASPNHNLVVASTIAAIHNQLRGKPCKIYPSDMKVRTPSTGSYLYPDISVVCGESQFDDEQRDILLNPTIIIEALSPNTERYDRGKKFQSYRELASMQEYILIAQDSPHIERFVRQKDDLWQFSEAHGLEASLDLASIMCKLALVEVYEQVDFDSADETEETSD
jgi:Uma2 family endonuclease